MTSKVVFAVLGLVLTLSACYAQEQGNKSELPIKNLERELEVALAKGDAVTLERLLAPDYFEIDARGGVKKKPDVLALARAVSSKPGAVTVGPEKTVDELTVRVYGDCAIVSGRMTIRYQFMEYQTSSPQAQGPATVDQERFTRTYSKLGGRWQLVAWQTTSIAKK
ncbi:MAG TPA: nuclear transport factor 2 family protein [Pyrinomonadaceae bacterium]|nr:nuclear transport factor 2 family protein [Pyrinomonadaceae bacterium]